MRLASGTQLVIPHGVVDVLLEYSMHIPLLNTGGVAHGTSHGASDVRIP